VWQAALMRVLLATVRLRQGRMRDAMEESRRALDQFTALGDRWGEVRAKLPLARALLLLGRVSEARALVDDPVTQLVCDVAVGNGSAALTSIDANVDGVAELNDLVVVRALALLQDGQATEAVDVLRRRSLETSEGGPRAHAQAALALALAAEGSSVEARSVAAEAIASAQTYSDRAIALMASATASARLADGLAARADLDRLRVVLAETEDVLTTNVARLASAHVLVALGDPEAATVERDARERLGRSGLDAVGWDRIFRTATGAGAAPVPG
jgi:hypothetical protein